MFKHQGQAEDDAEPEAEEATGPNCDTASIKPYQGALFDAMAQTGQGLDGEQAITVARSAGVIRMALFARVHKKENGVSLVGRMAELHPDFILRGAPKLFDMRGDLDGLYVDDVLEGVRDGRYAFVGEILYTHGDKRSGETTATGERYIDPTQPNTRRLIERLAGRHIPVITHWEVYDWDRDWPRFRELYSRFPDQIFIWPHLGFGNPEQVNAVLGSCPNVWATLSKKEKRDENLADPGWAASIGGPVIDRCGLLLPEWRALIMKYPDRLMFATDAHQANRWANYAGVVKKWRGILGQLPGGMAARIGHENAERLYNVRGG